MISNYTKECGYRLGQLKDYCLLVPYGDTNVSYTIDNGKPLVSMVVADTVLRIEGRNAQYTEEATNEERHQFSSKFTIFVKEGYSDVFCGKLRDIKDGNWMLVFEDIDGNQYMAGVDLPGLFTYNYNINDTDDNANGCEITFTFNGNVPLCAVKGKINGSEYIHEQCGYSNGYVTDLKLFDINDTLIVHDKRNLTEIITDDKSKPALVDFNEKSFVFEEELNEDGEYVQKITFSIMLSDFKRYFWHYDLIEFMDNRYMVTFRTSNNNIIASGFHNGYLPTYTISTSTQAATPNIITITLESTGDENCVFSHVDDQYIFVQDSTKVFRPTEDYFTMPDGTVAETHICDGNGVGYISLLREYTLTGRRLDSFKCLVGFENDYKQLNIVGTYTLDDDLGFPLRIGMEKCSLVGKCDIETNLTDHSFTDKDQNYQFGIESTCDWTLENLPTWLSASVTSGKANVTTLVILTATSYPEETPLTQTITIRTEGGNTYSATMRLLTDFGWFYSAQNYIIDADEHNIILQTNIDGKYLKVNALNGFSYPYSVDISRNQVMVRVDTNWAEVKKNMKFRLTNTIRGEFVDITITQDKMYYKWVEDKTTYVCEDGNSYYRKYKYYGFKSTTIDKLYGNPDTDFKKGSLRLENDSDCLKRQVEWRKTDKTVCEGSAEYAQEEQWVRYTNGLEPSDPGFYATQWIPNGTYRHSSLIDNTSPECDNRFEWVVVIGETICKNGFTYNKEQKYYNGIPMDEYRTGAATSNDYNTECLNAYKTKYPRWIHLTYSVSAGKTWKEGKEEMFEVGTQGVIHVGWGFAQYSDFSAGTPTLVCDLKKQGWKLKRDIYLFFAHDVTSFKILYSSDQPDLTTVEFTNIDMGLTEIDLGLGKMQRGQNKMRSVDLSMHMGLRKFSMPTPYYNDFFITWPTNEIVDNISINDGFDEVQPSSTQQTVTTWEAFLQGVPIVGNNRVGIFYGCPIKDITCNVDYSKLAYKTDWVFDRGCCPSNGSERYVVRTSTTTTCLDKDKYTQYDILRSTHDGTQWSPYLTTGKHQLGSLIERNSKDCGYIDELQYKWFVDYNKWICNEKSSYYVEVKYQSTDGKEWTECEPYTSRASSEVRKSDDVACGYIPSYTATYRWVNDGNHWICDDETITR